MRKFSLYAFFFLLAFIGASEAMASGRVDKNAIKVSRMELAVRTPANFLHPLVSPRYQRVADELVKTRIRECGGYRKVLAEIQHQYQQISPEEKSDVESEEGVITDLIVPKVLSRAVQLGLMSPYCVVSLYDSWNPEFHRLVMLTPEGDVVFEYAENQAFSPLSEVDWQSGWCECDSIGVADFTRDYDAAWWKTMSIVGIASAGR